MKRSSRLLQILKRFGAGLGIIFVGCLTYAYPDYMGLTSPDAFTIWQNIGSGFIAVGLVKLATAGLQPDKTIEEKRHEEIISRFDQLNARLAILQAETHVDQVPNTPTQPTPN